MAVDDGAAVVITVFVTVVVDVTPSDVVVSTDVVVVVVFVETRDARASRDACTSAIFRAMFAGIAPV